MPSAPHGRLIEGLVEAVCATFDHKDLERLVEVTLGQRLYVDFASPSQKLRDIVFQLVRETEQRGAFTILCRGLVQARPQGTALLAVVRQLAPDALEPQRESQSQVSAVVSGVRAVAARAGDPKVRILLGGSSPHLHVLQLNIDRLRRYKALHDCLHQIQIQHYAQARGAIRDFRTDPGAFDTLVNHLDGLRRLAVEAREYAAGLPPGPLGQAEETLWIEKLDEAVENLQSGLDLLEEQPVRAAISRLRVMLNQDPARINQKLTTTAAALPLDRLLETLNEVSRTLDPKEEAASRLREGQLAIQSLVPRLMGMVAAHSQWQRVEKELWLAEENLARGSLDDREEFLVLWPEIREQTQVLCQLDPGADWAVRLGRYGDAVQALGNGQSDPIRLRSAFNLFRREAMFHFFQLDQSLKELCTEVARIGDPLRELLEALTHGGR